MNTTLAEVIVELQIAARQLQETSASSGQEKAIYNQLLRIAQLTITGMASDQ
jgi:hypothetical protein